MPKHKRKASKECWMCVNCNKDIPYYCQELLEPVTKMKHAEDCPYFDYDETEMEALEEEQHE